MGSMKEILMDWKRNKELIIIDEFCPMLPGESPHPELQEVAINFRTYLSQQRKRRSRPSSLILLTLKYRLMKVFWWRKPPFIFDEASIYLDKGGPGFSKEMSRFMLECGRTPRHIVYTDPIKPIYYSRPEHIKWPIGLRVQRRIRGLFQRRRESKCPGHVEDLGWDFCYTWKECKTCGRQTDIKLRPEWKL